ncbi:MAG: phage holin family protein [Ardenticatenaceae bacterium]|nr:phage holin family protein [Ardenticatenaceae bacterium]
MKIIIRLVINAIALWVAATIIPGIELANDWVSVGIVALIFGVINTLIKPIIKLFSLPFILLTFGLFILVINAAMLGLTAYLSDALTVDGFFPAVFGAIVISIISTILEGFIRDDDDKRSK